MFPMTQFEFIRLSVVKCLDESISLQVVFEGSRAIRSFKIKYSNSFCRQIFLLTHANIREKVKKICKKKDKLTHYVCYLIAQNGDSKKML